MEYLFIDGYNAIHAWPNLTSLLRHNKMDAARAKFIESVRIIHDIEGLQLSVIFDGKSDKIIIENPSKEATFAVIYSSADISADGIIERLVRKVKDPRQCTVITRDNLVTESVRAAGCIAITPLDLWDWVERCNSHSQHILRQGRRKQINRMQKSTPWDILNNI